MNELNWDDVLTQLSEKLNANAESCDLCKWYNETEDGGHCSGCTHNAIDKYEALTNYDYITHMSIENMAKWLSETAFCLDEECPEWESVVPCNDCCEGCMIEWLNKPR